MTGDLPDENLSGFLTAHPGTPETPVVHWMDGSMTLGELSDAARTLADGLGRMDGAPVACVVDRGVDAVIAMFAAWLADGVYLPVNSRLPDVEMHRQLAEADPGMVVVSAADAGRVPARFTRIVAVGPSRWSVDTTGSPTRTRSSPGAALIMRTSGTTGTAKPIVLRHDGVREGIDTVIAQLRGSARNSDRPPMPNLIPTSLALWAGIWNTLFAFRLGAPLVLLDRFDPVDYAVLVKRFAIRSTVLAPAMMTMLATDPRVTDLGPLRMVRSVTAPLAPDQARRFHDRFGVDVLNSYGQTELGGEVVGWTAADIRGFGTAKLGAVGRPHPGVSVQVLDSDRQPVPADTVGEVWVRSPFAAGDGFQRTGDLGRLDHDGFLWIDGRVSDLINRGGLKIVPQDVEAVLRTHPQVADACVAGVPDERLGEVPVAWVRVAPGTSPDEEMLRSFLRDRVAGYAVPVAVCVMDSDFPRTEIGKVLRRELVASFEQENR